MSNGIENNSAMISLRESTLVALFHLRNSPSEQLDDVVNRLIMENTDRDQQPSTPKQNAIKFGENCASQNEKKYLIEVLGELHGANNLAEVFAIAVDLVGNAAPEAIEELSKHKLNCRYHVSKTALGVHLNNPYLGTLESGSGWWVSKNVSTEQTIAHLKALCLSANLEFGRDICFPVLRIDE